MPRPLLPLALTLLVLPALASAADVPARFGGKLASCPIPGMETGALCGRLPVWEDRVARSGRQIDLYVVVIPAARPDPLPDPLIFLDGGPGDDGTGAAAELRGDLWKLNRDRDLVFFDARGTGQSGGLGCRFPGSADDPQGYLRDMFPLEPIRTCAEELGRRADLTQYTNVQVADDLDDIREWLGYRRVNLWGASGGSRTAQVYLKRHPEHVRSVVLDAVVPIDFRSPLTFARSAQTALDRVFDDCAADDACRAAFPDLRVELAAVLERLGRAPGRGTAPHPGTGRPVELAMPRTSFLTTLRSMQYAPAGYARIPLVIHEAHAGNFGPILREAVERGNPGFWMGAFLAVTCAEDVARIEPAEVAAQLAGTYMGDHRLGQQQAACAVWPRAELPADFWAPAASPVPVLALSGWLDPVAPPEGAAEVLRHLPNSAHVVLRNSAHGSFGLTRADCPFDLIEQFVQDGSPFGLDTSCTREMKRPPFVLRDDPPAGQG